MSDRNIRREIDRMTALEHRTSPCSIAWLGRPRAASNESAPRAEETPDRASVRTSPERRATRRRLFERDLRDLGFGFALLGGLTILGWCVLGSPPNARAITRPIESPALERTAAAMAPKEEQRIVAESSVVRPESTMPPASRKIVNARKSRSPTNPVSTVQPAFPVVSKPVLPVDPELGVGILNSNIQQ